MKTVELVKHVLHSYDKTLVEYADGREMPVDELYRAFISKFKTSKDWSEYETQCNKDFDVYIYVLDGDNTVSHPIFFEITPFKLVHDVFNPVVEVHNDIIITRKQLINSEHPLVVEASLLTTDYIMGHKPHNKCSVKNAKDLINFSNKSNVGLYTTVYYDHKKIMPEIAKTHVLPVGLWGTCFADYSESLWRGILRELRVLKSPKTKLGWRLSGNKHADEYSGISVGEQYRTRLYRNSLTALNAVYTNYSIIKLS